MTLIYSYIYILDLYIVIASDQNIIGRFRLIYFHQIKPFSDLLAIRINSLSRLYIYINFVNAILLELLCINTLCHVNIVIFKFNLWKNFGISRCFQVFGSWKLIDDYFNSFVSDATFLKIIAYIINYNVKQKISCSTLKLNELSIQKPHGIWTHI